MAEHSMSSQLAMSRTPEKPEVTSVYDSMKGHYSDPACCLPVAPSMPLPATPSPFLNLRKP